MADAFLDVVDAGNSVFDVGSHIGYYALLALTRTNVTVHAFEPHPGNLERLKETIRINDIGDDVTVVGKAVSADEGQVKLLESELETMHTIAESVGMAASRTVDSVTLDGYTGEGVEMDPDVVKIDVEGGAAKVLEGASELIENANATWIVELHDDAERQAFDAKFGDGEYKVSHITGRHCLARP